MCVMGILIWKPIILVEFGPNIPEFGTLHTSFVLIYYDVEYLWPVDEGY